MGVATPDMVALFAKHLHHELPTRDVRVAPPAAGDRTLRVRCGEATGGTVDAGVFGPIVALFAEVLALEAVAIDALAIYAVDPTQASGSGGESVATGSRRTARPTSARSNASPRRRRSSRKHRRGSRRRPGAALMGREQDSNVSRTCRRDNR